MLPSFAEIETIFPVISVCFPHMINQTYFLNCLQVWLAGSALVDIVIAVSMVILVSLYISFRTYGPQATLGTALSPKVTVLQNAIHYFSAH